MAGPSPSPPRGLALGLSLAVGLFVLWLWAGAGSGGYFDGELEVSERLARAVARRSHASAGLHHHSGHSRFDGQAQIAIDQMTLLGLGQLLLRHPERRHDYLPAMEAAAARLVDPATLGYATSRYGQHGLSSLPAAGHAYLGYINLGLGMLRRVDPDTPHAALHDRLSERLARLLDRDPHGMVETYPGETWPPDVAAVAGSVGLHGLATGRDWRPLLDRWAERFAACAVHESGYLVQRLASGSCEPRDAPRGSGTAVAAYFLSFAHQPLAERLYAAVRDYGQRSLLGFAAVEELAEGFRSRLDVNAGPTLLGLSVGATGFALGAAAAHRDRASFTRLYRSASLFGLRLRRGDEERHAAGGLLGDALLLAMLTAGPR
ncbi:MAG: hypothetical protein R3B72_25355 [Polyangiaceae bacterium]